MKKTDSIKSWIISLMILLTIWQTATIIVQNPLLIPGPISVLGNMFQQLATLQFWKAMFLTAWRALGALFLSTAVSLVLSLSSLKWTTLEPYVTRLILLLRSIPNISFIILVLFWTGRETAILVILFLLLMPIAYGTFLSRLQEIQESWKPLLTVYPHSFFYTVRKVYMPFLEPTMESTVLSCSGLSFKACVTAEILCQIPYGLGRSMQTAKFQIDTASVIAFTFWIVLLSGFIHVVLKTIFKKWRHHEKSEYTRTRL